MQDTSDIIIHNSKASLLRRLERHNYIVYYSFNTRTLTINHKTVGLYRDLQIYQSIKTQHWRLKIIDKNIHTLHYLNLYGIALIKENCTD